MAASLSLIIVLGLLADYVFRKVKIPGLVGMLIVGILIIFVGLLFRSVGSYISLIETPLNLKERIFCVIAYIPKATVQAAIGAVPLAAGVAS